VLLGWRVDSKLVATAAQLADHVPPVQQRVLAVPKRLRYFLHRDADIFRAQRCTSFYGLWSPAYAHTAPA